MEKRRFNEPKAKEYEELVIAVNRVTKVTPLTSSIICTLICLLDLNTLNLGDASFPLNLVLMRLCLALRASLRDIFFIIT